MISAISSSFSPQALGGRETSTAYAKERTVVFVNVSVKRRDSLTFDVTHNPRAVRE